MVHSSEIFAKAKLISEIVDLDSARNFIEWDMKGEEIDYCDSYKNRVTKADNREYIQFALVKCCLSVLLRIEIPVGFAKNEVKVNL